MFEYELYTEGCVILKRFGGNGYDIDYVLIGCDFPIESDDEWRFWEEIGYSSGSSYNFKITLSEEDEREVKNYILSHIEDFSYR